MDLSTTYLGLELPHPFMIGASFLGDTIESLKQAQDAGAAAVVLRSLFEEQLRRESVATQAAMAPHSESFAEATTYFADPEDFVVGPDEYLKTILQAKGAVQIPIIASLNGTTTGGWLQYAKQMEDAGADALEINIYDVPTDPAVPSATYEDQAIETVAAVRGTIKIPLSVKISPFYTSLPHFAKRFVEAGADGLVLFNRFYEPDVDVEALEVAPHLELSTSAEVQLRLRWLAILSGQIQTSYAVTGGVHTAADAVKAVMCGASAVQIVSALITGGMRRLSHMREHMAGWLQEHEYKSLKQMCGSMNIARCPDPHLFERANYIHLLQTWAKD